ncbi:30S ribosomal protein S19 [Candidatus Woesearchaeota archaeon]|jgi:small subunit ribosomal protein S19|nr:30S ribosomal protein S19 [Candidatus Woesearchaeota archaeon]MBT5397338.1 30S ribosomal protein S19 [Candidatus Woesearchaeota archaeon]MBT6367817.1 30S ribosomal protein S19 [Candidatus Woesearchaeota archaeon]MBT7762738.1 30S ribosomal protein S19 [Candidatus Woesearchaeota archaeon]
MAIKEFKWNGKTEDELKQMDMDTFIELVPARQRRSLKRGFTDSQKSLLKRIDAGENNIKTHCRNMIILPSMIDKLLRIYNGKDFFPITITAEMVGHYLGEFAHTRKSVSHSSAGVGATRSSKSVSAR